MSKYRGPKCKLARREGEDLDFKIRSHESKSRSAKLPGQHGDKKPRLSDYGVQLRAKQKIRRYYGILEKQFVNYYKLADRQKGSTAENLMKLLERRLDNVVFRLGFASTRAEARQLVSHKAIRVNDQVVNIPSFLVKKGDIIAVRDKAKSQGRIIAAVALSEQRTACDWLNVDKTKFEGTFNYEPDLNLLPSMLKVNLVVELYSK